jgi:hypothetical protein
MKYRQKRPFLLLELLFSLILIGLLLVPLVKPYLQSLVGQHKEMRVLKNQILENQAFLHIKERLYKNDIAYESLKKGLSLDFEVDRTLCHANIQCLEVSRKEFFKKEGLLLKIDIHLPAAADYPSRILFVEGHLA